MANNSPAATSASSAASPTTPSGPWDRSLPFFPCEEMDLATLRRQPVVFENRVRLAVSRERLFEILETDHCWTRWPIGIAGVEWTSPKPFREGTTRTVTFLNGMKVYERFCEWVPNEALAFSLYGASDEVWSRFGERYELRALGPQECELTWTVAYTPAGVFAAIHSLVGPLMGLSSIYVAPKGLLQKGW